MIGPKGRAHSPEHVRVMRTLSGMQVRALNLPKNKRELAPTDLQIMTQADLESQRQVMELLADLADAHLIEIDRSKGARVIRVLPPPLEQGSEHGMRERKSASDPQKTATNGSDSPLAEIDPDTRQSSTPKPQKTAPFQPQQARPSTTPKRWPATKGRPPSVENRHPDELNLDDSYQRSTDNGSSRALIKRIATGWDWRMCMPLVVSKRDDGTLWVIDGQHRLAAAKLRGDIPFLPCCVGVYESVADEAAMFVAMNRQRRPISRLDDFHAAIASGDPEAIEIAKLITDAGFTVSRKTGSQSWVPGEVAFTSGIARVLRKHGAKVCADALTTMKDIWPGQVLNAGSSMFTALAKLAITPPDIADYDPARMHRAMGRRSQREWASWLTDTGGGGEQRAYELLKVLLMAYEEEGAAA